MATLEKFCAPGVFDPATYSQGVKVSGAQTILFLSGQVAYEKDGSPAFRGDFKAQARGAFECIKALVESHRGDRRRLNVFERSTVSERLHRELVMARQALALLTGNQVPL